MQFFWSFYEYILVLEIKNVYQMLNTYKNHSSTLDMYLC